MKSAVLYILVSDFHTLRGKLLKKTNIVTTVPKAIMTLKMLPCEQVVLTEEGVASYLLSSSLTTFAHLTHLRVSHFNV